MKVLDLFSGTGGFSLGFNTKTFDVGYFCEFEESCRKVIYKNFDVKFMSNDVNHLTVEEHEYDVMLGGFPCQDISYGGNNDGIDGVYTGLWRKYISLIDMGKPKYAVIENVNALTSRGLEILLWELAKIGYDATWTVYDTQYFGLPNRRRRIYIVAVRDGIPENTDMFEFKGRDIADIGQEMDNIKQGFEWDFTKEQGNKYPFAYLTLQRIKTYACTGVSSTICKRDYKQFTDMVFHDGKFRRVTPEERLLLQGYPRTYFDDCGLTDKEKFTMNGMSIPVVRSIANSIYTFDRTVNAPEWADFYADGEYRKYDKNSLTGSVFESNNSFHDSCYGVQRLESYFDYTPIQRIDVPKVTSEVKRMGDGKLHEIERSGFDLSSFF